MGGVHAVAENELTRMLAEQLRARWDAYLRVDEVAHGALLAEEYRAVLPDGSVHLGKPSAEEIAAAAIEDYWLREFQAWPAGDEAVIATYTAEVEVRNGLSAERYKLEVGGVWLRERGQWKCRYNHATPRK